MSFTLNIFRGKREGWDPVNNLTTSLVVVVIQTDRHKLVRNCCVIGIFGIVFVLLLWFFNVVLV